MQERKEWGPAKNGIDAQQRKDYWQQKREFSLQQIQSPGKLFTRVHGTKSSVAPLSMENSKKVKKRTKENRGAITPVESGDGPMQDPILKNKEKQVRSKARLRRTSCAGGALYREQFRQAEMAGKRTKRREELVLKLKSRLVGEEIEAVFANWDTDGNGTLSKHEIKAGLDRIGLSLLKNEFNELFDEIDINSDGEVTISELKTFAGTSWVKMPDARLQFNRQLTERRTKEQTQKFMADAGAIFAAQQMRRFKRQEMMQNGADRATKERDPLNSQQATAPKLGPTAVARERVRHFLIDRDMRYESEAAKRKQRRNKDAYLKKQQQKHTFMRGKEAER
jgi:hypothetical protein